MSLARAAAFLAAEFRTDERHGQGRVSSDGGIGEGDGGGGGGGVVGLGLVLGVFGGGATDLSLGGVGVKGCVGSSGRTFGTTRRRGVRTCCLFCCVCCTC